MRHTLSAAFIGAGMLLSSPMQAAEAPRPEILCLGDSITAGEGGDGTSWPCNLATLSGAYVINRGSPGWIPRHLKYQFYLQDCPTLSTAQLRSIPPRELENRLNQPKINQLRPLLKDGVTVKVRGEGAAEVTLYRWDGQCVSDGEGFLRPDAVGNPSATPPVENGRWVRKGKESTVPAAKGPDICVIWVGANGMQADDVRQTLAAFSAELRPRGTRILALGLVNRLPQGAPSEEIANWAKWIKECNEVVQKEFPKDNLDLQAWLTASGPYAGGGYRTRDWLPQATDAEVAADLRDQAAGLMPTSLRPKDNITHINATGYRVIASLVYEALKTRGWLPATPVR